MDLILLVIIASAALVFFMVYWQTGRKVRMRKALKKYGICVQAVVEDVRVNRAVRVNDRHPYVAYVGCVHPVTKETVSLPSHSKMVMTVQAGDIVNVYFDPRDEKKYAVDLPEGK